jgi:hypothetical protein
MFSMMFLPSLRRFPAFSRYTLSNLFGLVCISSKNATNDEYGRISSRAVVELIPGIVHKIISPMFSGVMLSFFTLAATLQYAGGITDGATIVAAVSSGTDEGEADGKGEADCKGEADGKGEADCKGEADGKGEADWKGEADGKCVSEADCKAALKNAGV